MTNEEMMKQYMTEQAEISRKVFAEHGAEYKGIGKTKAIGAMKDGNVMMRFLDSYTGHGNVKDGGGNDIAGYEKGLGRMNLEMTTKIYKMLEEELGIPTQNVEYDLENNLLIAKRASLLGKDMPFEMMPIGENGKQVKDGKPEIYTSKGIEVIARNVGTGSFQNQWPHIKDGVDLTDERGMPLIDLTVKSDEAGDPKFPRSVFVNSGYVYGPDLDKSIDYTKRATRFLTERFNEKGVKFLDTKMEYGVDAKTNVILVDEISTGTSRLRKDGKKMSEKEIHETVMSF